MLAEIVPRPFQDIKRGKPGSLGVLRRAANQIPLGEMRVLFRDLIECRFDSESFCHLGRVVVEVLAGDVLQLVH